MTDQAKQRNLAELEQMIKEMQYLVDHPRMQQRNWVASGKRWLPILEHMVEGLQSEVNQFDYVAEAYQSLMAALGKVGLQILKRDGATWGYRWHNGDIKGTFPSRAAAVEAALRERLA